MKLVFVRHGESTANRLREFSNSGFKHPLTEEGVGQAIKLAVNLSGLHVAQIYTSPVLRAVQTAQVLADQWIAPLRITEALREWDVGIYEGSTGPSGWELHRKVQQDWFEKGQLDSCMPGGESYKDIQARFVPFIEEILRTQNNPDLDMILVSHGGLYIAMLPEILKNIAHAYARGHAVPYTGCVVAEPGSDGLVCLSWDGVPLLDQSKEVQ